MSNYKKTHVTDIARTELHDTLGLTGAEISINNLDAGASVPFVHFHKSNEEIYGITSGNGRVIIDGEEIELAAGDWIRVSSSAKRQFFASQSSPLNYICIQVKENSLVAFTMSDAEIVK